MIRLLADENFDQDLVRGMLRRRPGFDVVRAQDVGLLEAADPGRTHMGRPRAAPFVITHDVKTMIGFARERISRGEAMAGLLVVHLVSRQPPTCASDVGGGGGQCGSSPVCCTRGATL